MIEVSDFPTCVPMTGLFRRCIDDDEAVRFLQLFFKLRLESYPGSRNSLSILTSAKKSGSADLKQLATAEAMALSSDA